MFGGKFVTVENSALGAGANGAVSKVKEVRTGEISAVKKMKLYYEDLDSEDFADKYRKFVIEMEILMNMDHKNIMDARASAVTDAIDGISITANMVVPLFTMTLEDAIFTTKQKFTYPIIKSLSTQLFNGLAYLEHVGVVHKDLKPSNLMLTDDGVLKIIDFGESFPVDRTEVVFTGSTIFYQAPELLVGYEEVNHAVDVWAAGCSLMEMFIHELLFYKKSTKVMYNAMLRSTPVKQRTFTGMGARDGAIFKKLNGRIKHDEGFNIFSLIENDERREEVKEMIGTEVDDFIEFMKLVFTFDGGKRPSASELVSTSAWLREYGKVPVKTNRMERVKVHLTDKTNGLDEYFLSDTDIAATTKLLTSAFNNASTLLPQGDDDEVVAPAI